MKRVLLAAAIWLAALPLARPGAGPARRADRRRAGRRARSGRRARRSGSAATPSSRSTCARRPSSAWTKVPIGVTKPERGFFAPGGLAASAAVKHLPMGQRAGFWEAYKSEIAAYQLDRLLGLDMVPPTVERRVGGDLASVQLWVEGCKHRQGRRPVGVPEADRVGEAGLPAEGLRQPDREHRPQRRQPPGGRRVEPDPDRPLARVRERQDALREGDDPDRPRVVRAAEGPRRGRRS